MKKSILLFFCLLFFSCFIQGQAPADSLHFQRQFRRIAGLNMTPLATQLIPFNRSSPNEAGPFLLRFKSYGRKHKSAFRLSMGLRLSADDDDNGTIQMNLAIGWEKRRSISRRGS